MSVGFEPQKKTYRLWRPGTQKVIISRDVKVREPVSKKFVTIAADLEEPIINGPGYNTRSKSRESQNVCTNGELLMAKEKPQAYEEAMASTDSIQWKNAMHDEMEALKKNDTWEMVSSDEVTKQEIKNRWILRLKKLIDGSVDHYKARLVVKGCSQTPDIDFKETFSPVARFESVQTVISVAAANDFRIIQFDVKALFPDGEKDEEIYMYQPTTLAGYAN